MKTPMLIKTQFLKKPLGGKEKQTNDLIVGLFLFNNT